MTNIMVLDFEGNFEQHLDVVRGSKVTYVKSTLEMLERCQEDCYSVAIVDFDHPFAQLDSSSKSNQFHQIFASSVSTPWLILKSGYRYQSRS